MSETITRLSLGKREFILIGTAHVSQASIQEVTDVIQAEAPDLVAVELDAGRYRSLAEPQTWEKLDIFDVLKKRQGFLLLANLALASFQKKIGDNVATKPGQEMLAAIQAAQTLNVPFELIDREIQITLRRAWKRSSLWGKNKLLALLFSSIFSGDKSLEEQDIEQLKKKNELDHMMDELAKELPTVKEVLIDERDRFLASKLFETTGNKVVAVVGAGHVPGMTRFLTQLQEGLTSSEVSDINVIPPPSWWSRVWPFLIPATILGLIVAGILVKGTAALLPILASVALTTAGFAVLGSILALAHPLTILVAAITAPIAALFHPLVHVFYFTGTSEASLRRPRIGDLENLSKDSSTLRGFYRNRVLRILLVILFSTVGATVGMYATLPVLLKFFLK